jgi:ankyrin repeat protein
MGENFDAATETIQMAFDAIVALERIAKRNPEFLSQPDSNGNTLLHHAARKITTRGFLEAFLSLCPSAEALTMQNNNGGTPLALACYHARPLEVVEVLIETGPKALQITAREGWLPLHIACRYASSMQVILMLFNGHPVASRRKANDGWTPLHILCRYRGEDLTVEVVDLFLKAFPEALTSRNNTGSTPINIACCFNAPVHVLQSVIQRDNALLQYVNNFGCTALYYACNSDTLPDEMVLDMANRWPVSSIVSAKKYLPLPYDRAVAVERPTTSVIDAIASTTIQAACAMLECALFSARSTAHSTVIDHLELALVTAIQNLSLDTLRDGNTSSLALIETVRPHFLEPELIQTLVHNDSLREWMKAEHVQRLINGLVRMNRAGRDYVMQT